MKRKIVFLILLVLLTLSITYGEYKYIESQFAEKPETSVVFLSTAVKKGHLFTREDFVMKLINSTEVESTYVREISDVIDTYANQALSKGELLLDSHVAPVDQLSLAKDDESIWVTFEFTGETSNGWNLRENQAVKLLFAPKDGTDYTLYEEVIVKRVYDQNVMDISTSSTEERRYVTFEIETLKGYELISKRNEGRVEIIIL